MPSSITSSELARVLLVDDNEAFLARAKAILASQCTVVGVVTSGRAALDAVRTLSPDVVVLDISMDGMSGLEVADRLRRTGSTVPIVFLTVHDEEDVVDAALDAGGTGYVVKPRLTSDLPLAVREACAGRSFVSPMR